MARPLAIDTHAHFFPESYLELIADLVKLVGADRVMMGTDYCFDIAYTEPVQVVEQTPGLSEEDRAQILGGNARRLLKLA